MTGKPRAFGLGHWSLGFGHSLVIGVWTLVIASTAGCTGFGFHKKSSDFLTVEGWKKPNVELPPPPQETVLRAGHWEKSEAPQPGTLAGDLASAKVLYQQGKHKEAAKVFDWLAERAKKAKNDEIHEEALFWQGECLYALRDWTTARDKYQELLTNHPSSRYRNEAVQRQYDIAKYWLDDTRAAMNESKADKSWWSMPTLVHFEKEKPTFDEEGHAIRACEQVYLQDPTGPLAAQALYWAGGVNFYRENYEAADRYYSILVEQFPRSPLAPQALELAIHSKINMTGGAPYDGRKLIEARQLTDTALRSYPELTGKQEFLENTLLSINEQQAEKDFSVAEFYRRTGHPGAAYFYYEIVRRRYAGTDWDKKAYARMLELRTKLGDHEAPSNIQLEIAK
jgi:outer membrane protein assembly factor BamD (BamD/ComL family)